MRNTRKSLLLSIFLLTIVYVPGCRAQFATGNAKSHTSIILDGTLNATQKMAAQRASHTATLLNNGKVFAAVHFSAHDCLRSRLPRSICNW